MYAVRQLLHLIVWVYLLVVFGRLILDWIRVFARDWRPKGVMLVVAETVYTLTDPPLRALRKVVPPLRIGGVALDLAFLLLVVVLYVLLAIL
ncbi:MAG TPA: YggT family protein [Phycicoccus elongatus]|jgi:YggT family protein|uniref:YggT family protein n=1 Tax=Phycicoccus elongatus Lp2 TaxID=1193181 RepID=N0E465_9MICO|nr:MULTISPECIES: YggT family protein [Phycicoccus]MBK8730071.1 YggT family protein [Tetrasphaera sp.]MCA0321928.1 YggT family protein [Actinomycetota bacterium]MCB1240482.1 YggT family protein [Tetrasphaera sp.]MCB9405790.1 YggT family protein [Tetrasphaera sp.]MCO5302863.1 YggT family protein [Phycicoccus sp.]